jgi:hypothetical protein
VPSLPSHKTPHSRQLQFFTSETSKTLILYPAPAISSDAFRKGVTPGTPPSPVRNGRGFRPWKTVLGSTTPSTGEATPRGVAVAKAFAQENPSTMPSEGLGTKASYLRRRRPDAQHRGRRRGHCCPLVATHHHRGARSNRPQPQTRPRRTHEEATARLTSAPHRRTTMGSLPPGAPQPASTSGTTNSATRPPDLTTAPRPTCCGHQLPRPGPPTAALSMSHHTPRTEAAPTLEWPTAHGSRAPPKRPTPRP